VRAERISEQLDGVGVRDRTAGSVEGVVLHAAIDGGSEAADETRTIASHLAGSDLPIQIVPRGTPHSGHSGTPLSQRKTLDKLIARRLDLSRSVLFQSGTPTDWNLDFYGRCRVGRAAFGTDRIPDGWADRCNALDELWLPSEFHRETFTASGAEARKIRVVPTGVDTKIFRPGCRPFEIPHSRSFCFLAISDGFFRSGADIVVKAYVEEFAPEEDVTLLLSDSSGLGSAPRSNVQADLLEFVAVDLGRQLKEIPAVVFLDGALDPEDRARLFASSHAFANTMRADATGRACLEALASEVPVIATNWGPARQFLTEGNSFPVEASDIVPTDSKNELVAGHRWAEPNRNQLRRRMREVFSNKREATNRAQQGRRDALERFEWSVVFPQWAREFQRLLG
jgi:glycosyltransferase involved in cell wall biosynthesis